MVYSSDILNSSLSSDRVEAQDHASSNPAVSVQWNDIGIHTIAGPTPFVDISYSAERNGAGGPESYTTKITLTGKIIRIGQHGTTPTYGSGVAAVVSGISELKNLFTKNDFGILKITCGTSTINPIFSATGVRVMSLDFSKTNDNWVSTADYSIGLEYTEPALSDFYVKGTIDSWNIEPLEDYTYSQEIIRVDQKQEYHNPQLKPTAPTDSVPQPAAASAANGDGASRSAIAYINITSIPRFKISHTLSAIGMPSGSGNNAHLESYLNAKKWVDYRLSYGLGTYSMFPGDTKTTPTTGIIALSSTLNPTPPFGDDSGFLYNHLRAVNFSLTEGKYEITDTWLSMPTGIGYTEDYTIELSTDERYIHTVRVQGEIMGLSMVPVSVLSGDPSFITVNSNGLTNINLSSSTGVAFGPFPTFPKIPDNMDQNSINAQLYASKYSNAASGWLNDIKPYLYRRACIVMNSQDRNRTYINPAASPQPPPGNPIYSTLGLLNIVPISTSEGHNTRKGSISYSYEFTNKFTIISGVISESVSIDDTGPTDVIGEAFVLGRSLGPILQNLGTKTSSKKSVSLEVSVVPPSSLKGFFMQNSDCPLWTGGTVYSQITGLIEGLKPFGDRPTAMFGTPTFQRSGGAVNVQGQVFVASDSQTWDPTNGRYTKSMSWIYQQCNNNQPWMDH